MGLKETFKTVKTDGSLFILKWSVGVMVVGAIVGYVLGVTKVQLFEQTPSGRYATHEECVAVDEDCLRVCEEADQDPWGGSSPDCACCLEFRTVVDPLGDRLANVGMTWMKIGGVIGFTIGFLYGAEKWKGNLDT